MENLSIDERRSKMLVHADEAILGTVADMLKENVPGSERIAVEDLIAIVRKIHLATIEDFLAGKVTTQEAAKREWKLIAEELSILPTRS